MSSFIIRNMTKNSFLNKKCLNFSEENETVLALLHLSKKFTNYSELVTWYYSCLRLSIVSSGNCCHIS